MAITTLFVVLLAAHYYSRPTHSCVVFVAAQYSYGGPTAGCTDVLDAYTGAVRSSVVSGGHTTIIVNNVPRFSLKGPDCFLRGAINITFDITAMRKLALNSTAGGGGAYGTLLPNVSISIEDGVHFVGLLDVAAVALDVWPLRLPTLELLFFESPSSSSSSSYVDSNVLPLEFSMGGGVTWALRHISFSSSVTAVVPFTWFPVTLRTGNSNSNGSSSGHIPRNSRFFVTNTTVAIEQWTTTTAVVFYVALIAVVNPPASSTATTSLNPHVVVFNQTQLIMENVTVSVQNTQATKTSVRAFLFYSEAETALLLVGGGGGSSSSSRNYNSSSISNSSNMSVFSFSDCAVTIAQSSVRLLMLAFLHTFNGPTLRDGSLLEITVTVATSRKSSNTISGDSSSISCTDISTASMFVALILTDSSGTSSTTTTAPNTVPLTLEGSSRLNIKKISTRLTPSPSSSAVTSSSGSCTGGGGGVVCVYNSTATNMMIVSLLYYSGRGSGSSSPPLALRNTSQLNILLLLPSVLGVNASASPSSSAAFAVVSAALCSAGVSMIVGGVVLQSTSVVLNHSARIRIEGLTVHVRGVKIPPPLAPATPSLQAHVFVILLSTDAGGVLTTEQNTLAINSSSGSCSSRTDGSGNGSCEHSSSSGSSSYSGCSCAAAVVISRSAAAIDNATFPLLLISTAQAGESAVVQPVAGIFTVPKTILAGNGSTVRLCRTNASVTNSMISGTFYPRYSQYIAAGVSVAVDVVGPLLGSIMSSAAAVGDDDDECRNNNATNMLRTMNNSTSDFFDLHRTYHTVGKIFEEDDAPLPPLPCGLYISSNDTGACATYYYYHYYYRLPTTTHTHTRTHTQETATETKRRTTTTTTTSSVSLSLVDSAVNTTTSTSLSPTTATSTTSSATKSPPGTNTTTTTPTTSINKKPSNSDQRHRRNSTTLHSSSTTMNAQKFTSSAASSSSSSYSSSQTTFKTTTTSHPLSSQTQITTKTAVFTASLSTSSSVSAQPPVTISLAREKTTTRTAFTQGEEVSPPMISTIPSPPPSPDDATTTEAAVGTVVFSVATVAVVAVAGPDVQAQSALGLSRCAFLLRLLDDDDEISNKKEAAAVSSSSSFGSNINSSNSNQASSSSPSSTSQSSVLPSSSSFRALSPFATAGTCEGLLQGHAILLSVSVVVMGTVVGAVYVYVWRRWYQQQHNCLHHHHNDHHHREGGGSGGEEEAENGTLPIPPPPPPPPPIHVVLATARCPSLLLSVAVFLLTGLLVCGGGGGGSSSATSTTSRLSVGLFVILSVTGPMLAALFATRRFIHYPILPLPLRHRRSVLACAAARVLLPCGELQSVAAVVIPPTPYPHLPLPLLAADNGRTLPADVVFSVSSTSAIIPLTATATHDDDNNNSDEDLEHIEDSTDDDDHNIHSLNDRSSIHHGDDSNQHPDRSRRRSASETAHAEEVTIDDGGDEDDVGRNETHTETTAVAVAKPPVTAAVVPVDWSRLLASAVGAWRLPSPLLSFVPQLSVLALVPALLFTATVESAEYLRFLCGPLHWVSACLFWLFAIFIVLLRPRRILFVDLLHCAALLVNGALVAATAIDMSSMSMTSSSSVYYLLNNSSSSNTGNNSTRNQSSYDDSSLLLSPSTRTTTATARLFFGRLQTALTVLRVAHAVLLAVLPRVFPTMREALQEAVAAAVTTTTTGEAADATDEKEKEEEEEEEEDDDDDYGNKKEVNEDDKKSSKSSYLSEWTYVGWWHRLRRLRLRCAAATITVQNMIMEQEEEEARGLAGRPGNTPSMKEHGTTMDRDDDNEDEDMLVFGGLGHAPAAARTSRLRQRRANEGRYISSSSSATSSSSFDSISLTLFPPSTAPTTVITPAKNDTRLSDDDDQAATRSTAMRRMDDTDSDVTTSSRTRTRARKRFEHHRPIIPFQIKEDDDIQEHEKKEEDDSNIHFLERTFYSSRDQRGQQRPLEVVARLGLNDPHLKQNIALERADREARQRQQQQFSSN